MNLFLFGYISLLSCSEDKPASFENQINNVYVQDLTETMDRMEITSVEEILCEDLCYTIAGTFSREYNITECTQELDAIVWEEDISTLDPALLVGTVTCTGTILNYEK